MKKQMLALLWCLGGALSLLGQTLQHPFTTVNFPTGQDMCDDEPYKLVFQDDFNGTTLSAPWITFCSFLGMGTDYVSWNGARYSTMHYPTLYKQENVIVSGGTVKLRVKREGTTTDTSYFPPQEPSVSANYTGGWLALPYQIGGYNRAFNSGYFEARIKFPTFFKFHGCMWLWNGHHSVPQYHGNEIDIAEGYGKTSGFPLFSGQPRTNFSTHIWPPDGTDNLMFNLNHCESGPHHTPKSDWWHFSINDFFKIDDFHKYSVRWDTALIQWNIDDEVMLTMPKYYKIKHWRRWWWPPWRPDETVMLRSDCEITDDGGWNPVWGFPYDKNSLSQLRFTADVDGTSLTHFGMPEGVLGDMEIDYVKIWQRRPENGWKDLNAAPEFNIIGSNIVCSTATYTVNNPQPNGYWQVDYGLEIVSSTNSTVTVKIMDSWPLPTTIGKVIYRPNNPAFTEGTALAITKKVDRGTSTNSAIICSKTTSGGFNPDQVWFNIGASGLYYKPIFGLHYVDYQSPTTFQWSISYGPGLAYNFSGTGQYITTPPVPCTLGAVIPVQWSVVITNACGTITKSGSQSFMIKHYGLKPILPDTSSPDGNMDMYVESHIPDIKAYDQAVRERFAQQYFLVSDDTTAISAAFSKVELQELAPYILNDSEPDSNTRSRPAAPLPQVSGAAFQSTIFPNPATKTLNILAGSSYTDGVPMTLSLVDQTGRTVLERVLIHSANAVTRLDVSGLQAGLYHFSIRQAGQPDEHRAVLIVSE